MHRYFNIFITGLLVFLFSCSNEHEKEIKSPTINNTTQNNLRLSKPGESISTVQTINAKLIGHGEQLPKPDMENETEFSVTVEHTEDNGQGTINLLEASIPAMEKSTSEMNRNANEVISQLPSEITYTPAGIYVKVNGKSKEIELDENFGMLMSAINKIKGELNSQSHQPAKVDLTGMTEKELVKHFEDNGYSVTVLGENKYELSKAMPMVMGTGEVTIKSVYNANTGKMESSSISRNGLKEQEITLENLNENEYLIQSKLFNPKEKGRNLLITRKVVIK